MRIHEDRKREKSTGDGALNVRLEFLLRDSIEVVDGMLELEGNDLDRQKDKLQLAREIQEARLSRLSRLSVNTIQTLGAAPAADQETVYSNETPPLQGSSANAEFALTADALAGFGLPDSESESEFDDGRTGNNLAI